MNCDHSKFPHYLQGDDVFCSGCNRLVPKKVNIDELNWEELFGDVGDIAVMSSPPKCTCGAEKIYGVPAPGHYADCQINDKRK